MIKILLAEDQQLVRQGLKMMIEHQGDMQVTGEAANGQEAIALLEVQTFDVVILDIRMPIMDGLEAARMIRKRWPEMVILMLTTFNDEEYALQALKANVNGYLLKDGESEALVRSIHSALEGGLVLEDQVAAKVMPTLMQQQQKKEKMATELTPREQEIITCIGQGMNNQEIAATLFLSVGTIKNQISVILDKLALRDRTQIAIYALNHDPHD